MSALKNTADWSPQKPRVQAVNPYVALSPQDNPIQDIKRQVRGSLPRGLVLVVDCFIMVGGYYLAYVLRFGLPLPPENLVSLRLLTPWIILSTIAVLGSLGLYGTPPYNGSNTLRSTIVAVGVSEAATMVGAYWFRGFAFPRTVFALSIPIHLVVLLLWRFIVALTDERMYGKESLLVISGNPDDNGGGLFERLPQVGNLVARLTPQEFLSTPFESLPAFDGAVLTGVSDHDKRAIMQRFLKTDKRVLINPEPLDIVLASAKAGQVADHPVLLIQGFGLTPGQALAKRCVDIVAAIIGLTVTSPIMLVAALAVAAGSGFPIIYRQQRVGLRGRPFQVYKFRTMMNGAEEVTGPVLSNHGDPRITKVGRILRALRLDELPQLINVLKGDMSIVGPRPERPEFVADYERTVRGYGYRLAVKPGLTGLAQVKGKYSTSPEDKLLYDLNYITNYSLALDAVIVLQTLVVLLTPEAAQGIAGDIPQCPRGSRAMRM